MTWKRYMLASALAFQAGYSVAARHDGWELVAFLCCIAVATLYKETKP